jgi:hypothetical protein
VPADAVAQRRPTQKCHRLGSNFVNPPKLSRRQQFHHLFHALLRANLTPSRSSSERVASRSFLRGDPGSGRDTRHQSSFSRATITPV